MQFLNLNGQSYKVSLAPYRKERVNASAPAKQARALLKTLFPCEQVLEELPIKVEGKTLYIDFFIPTQKLVVEVNGEQHRKFNKMHHGTMQGFLQAKKNDKKKAQWCAINNLELVVLDDDRESEWEQLITER